MDRQKEIEQAKEVEPRSLENIQVKKMDTFDYEDTRAVKDFGISGGDYKIEYVLNSDIERVSAVIKDMERLPVASIKGMNHPKYEESGIFLLGKMTQSSDTLRFARSLRHPNFTFYILKGKDGQMEMLFESVESWEIQMGNMIIALQGVDYYNKDPKKFNKALWKHGNISVFETIDYHLEDQEDKFKNNPVKPLGIDNKYEYLIYFDHLSKTAKVNVLIGGEEETLYQATFKKDFEKVVIFEENKYWEDFIQSWSNYRSTVFEKGTTIDSISSFGVSIKTDGSFNYVFFGNYLNDYLFPVSRDEVNTELLTPSTKIDEIDEELDLEYPPDYPNS